MTAIEPYHFRAPLTICFDFKNPYSYLAKDPTYALADELDIEVDWLPFSVAAIPLPVAATPEDDRGTRHRSIRSAYLERDLERYGELCGLTLRNIYRNPDTSRACAVLLWLKKLSDSLARRYIDLVFERYFNDTFDIEADTALQALVEEIVGEIGEEIGADLDGLPDCFGADALSAVTTLHAQLAEAGIFNVPGFVVEGEIYNGREHLPMIRWILTGRNGPGPI